MSASPEFADILAARDRLAGVAIRTPLLEAPSMSELTGARVFVKPECLQRTGSFKFRGAWSAISALRPASVVACSSGNHAQGIAEAARLAGIPSTIVMPHDAPAPKRERTEASGARVVGYDRVSEDRDAIAADLVAQEGGAFIHPFDNFHVIAGQGTVGLEIADDLAASGETAPIVLVPCSGGGLAAGVSLAVTERLPGAEIYAVEPEGFDDYARSLAAGKPQRNAKLGGSVCDALLAPEPGAIGWSINSRRLAGALAVSDHEALVATGYAFEGLRLVAEPGGAVALAAVLSGKLEFEGRTVVVVLSGGNVSDGTLAEGLSAYRSEERVRSALSRKPRSSWRGMAGVSSPRGSATGS